VKDLKIVAEAEVRKYGHWTLTKINAPAE